ncbi:tail-anchored protein insertion receptor WRB-like [Anneissia japonica]|uniref:tail-anchored protein insertion receptor WRB-like n=1 Tax=Anneissia japonica TaxID=1529436 RepID=UPI001425ACC9|nr:tail-anchored protein insertion receptor WRB-like [Anneissia japonica]
MAPYIDAVVVAFLVFMLLLFQICIPFFVKKILKIAFRVSSKELDLQTSLLDLQSEKDQVDVKEEFAKYAKIERKINKVVTELKEARNARRFDIFKVSWILNLAGKFLCAVGFVIMIWSYRTSPLVTLKEEWLFPLAGILAFPTGQSGSIGITCWVLICKIVIEKSNVMNKLKTISGKSKQY